VSKNQGVSWEKAVDFVAKDQNMKKNLILSTIRLARVGRFAGVSVFEILSIIGQEESMKRINNLLSRLKE
jgi:glutamyl/glutaminyl-tRNA synthetase